MLFAVLTWQVAGHGPLRALDERLGRVVAGGSIPAGLAEFFADLGNTAVALPVLSVVMVWAGWTGWLGRRGVRGIEDVKGTEDGEVSTGAVRGPAPVRWWLPPLAAGLALAAVPALVVPLKLWLARPGPPEMAGAAPAFYPSGHGATAAVAYGAAGLLLLRGRRWMRAGDGAATARPHPPAATATAIVVTVLVTLLNVGVGIGLVRRGYHWPLDVLGSWCLAGVLLAGWCAVCDRCDGGGGRAVRREASDGAGPDGP
ncbi:phosphatase PAP2 family protein [Streptomyces sp. DSM 41527]|uniref:Phosphatase PAP2 family protein n=1 Tax=Streptomyces mooreae TaxID=3075523 RepID=A0ABU2TBB0_9ACTN|nr:phosphatase PAP2 family protein [Streptomyces sp. DSM 41527]MDT0458212.1 phosphatase PAP2 family protein [Streptomyces sp. DSM 41527]